MEGVLLLCAGSVVVLVGLGAPVEAARPRRRRPERKQEEHLCRRIARSASTAMPFWPYGRDASMSRSVKSRMTWRPPLPVLSIVWRCADSGAPFCSRPFLFLRNSHRNTLTSMPTMAKNAAAANQYRFGTSRGASSSPPTSPGFHPHAG